MSDLSDAGRIISEPPPTLKSGASNKMLVDLRLLCGIPLSLLRKFKQRAIHTVIWSLVSRDKGDSFLGSIFAAKSFKHVPWTRGCS